MIALLLSYTALYVKTQNFEYLVVEQHIEYKLLFYLLIFLFGIELGKRAKHVENYSRKEWIGLVACIFIIYVHKLLMMQGWAGAWQFVQQAAIFPVMFFAIRLANHSAIARLMQAPWVGQFMMVCAAMTLELYMVHGPIREPFNPGPKGFPGNVVSYLPMVVLAAYLVHIISQFLREHMLTEGVSKSVSCADSS